MADVSRTPSVEQFKAEVEERFRYLMPDFAMRQVEPELANPFAVAFENDITRVTVEGTSWGTDVQVYLRVQDVSSHVEYGTPFWAVLKHLRPKEWRDLLEGSQLEKIASYAELIRIHIPEVLRGEAHVIEEVEAAFTPEWGYGGLLR